MFAVFYALTIIGILFAIAHLKLAGIAIAPEEVATAARELMRIKPL
jgi:uncharacterized membrane protein YccF (DUF307 family)